MWMMDVCVARQDRRAEPLTSPGRHLKSPCCRVLIGQLDVIRFVRNQAPIDSQSTSYCSRSEDNHEQ